MKWEYKKAIILALFIVFLFPVALAFAAGDTGAVGAKAAQGDRNLPLEKMLTYALQDEYMAREEYGLVIEKFGSRRLFSNMVRAEDEHIARLKPLLAQYGVPLPPEKYNPAVPSTFLAALVAGAKTEQDNIAMYDLFLQQDLPADVREVFVALRDASRQHLQAFQRS